MKLFSCAQKRVGQVVGLFCWALPPSPPKEARMHAPLHKCTVCGAKLTSLSAAEACARRDFLQMMRETPRASKERRRRVRVPQAIR